MNAESHYAVIHKYYADGNSHPSLYMLKLIAVHSVCSEVVFGVCYYVFSIMCRMFL